MIKCRIIYAKYSQMMVYLLQPLFESPKKKDKMHPLRTESPSIGTLVFDEINMDYIEFYKESNSVVFK